MKFPWTKEPEVVPDEPVRDARIASEGWILFASQRPKREDIPVRWMREFKNPFILSARELHPLTNSFGLYWKPTAIYREVSGESE